MDAENRPASYDSMRTILAHMPFQKRLEIYDRCPSLRSAERAVPVKLNSLELGDHEIIVNDVKYKLTIHQDYPQDKMAEKTKRQNDGGGVSYDFDEYGIQDFTTEYVVSPGDVIIKDKDFEERREEMRMEELLRLEGLANIFVGDREQRIRENPENPNMAMIGEDVDDNPYNMNTMIKDCNNMLIPYICKRDRVPFPYNFYIRFTKTEGDGTKTTEILEYSKKLHDASKYLFNKLFGERTSKIYVKTLRIRRNVPIMTLRLPENIKFKVGGRLIVNEEQPMEDRTETLKKFIEN